jgi:hypothetical protein
MTVETNGRFILYPMILDTGADYTSFPGALASFLGHDNQHPQVVREKTSGIGGQAVACLHSLRLFLVDPKTPIKTTKHIAVPVCVWKSSIKRFRFIEGFDCPFGLLGRDLMQEWKCVSLSPSGTCWMIQITI